jgi:hypothetical protein
VFDVIVEQRPDPVQVQAEQLRVRTGMRLALLGVLGPPGAHAVVELVGHRLTEPSVQTGHLGDRVGLHRAEIDVVETALSASAELDDAFHPDRPLVDVQLTEIAPVEVIGEATDNVGVDVRHRQHHVGRVSVRHDEAGVRESPTERAQREHVRGRLQPPGPSRLAPLQELEHPALVGVGRREIGLVDEPFRIRRHLRVRLEDLRLEIQRHQVEAFHRTVDVGRNMSPGAGHDLDLARWDARVVAAHGGRRRARLGGLPNAQIPDVRILGEQERQSGGSGAGQANSEQRRADGFLVDLGVPAVPILDLQPLREVQPDAAVDEFFTAGV